MPLRWILLVVAVLGAPVASGHAQSEQVGSLEESKQRAASLTGARREAFLLITESPMVKVLPDRASLSGRPGAAVEIAAARGEVEAGQVVVAPLDRGLESVRFRVSPLVAADRTALPDDAVRLDVVGYVHTDSAAELAYEVDDAGWFPDPILSFLDSFDVERDRVQSLWLRVRVPLDQPAGVYEGEITISPANADARSIAVRVRVFDFALPTARSLPVTITTFEDRIEAFYGDAWSDELRWRYAEFLLSNRLNYDNAYRDREPLPTVEQVRRLVAKGQDAWGLRFIRQPGQGFSDVGPDSSVYAAYIDQAVEDARATLPVLREAGAEHLAYIYLFDEVRENHWAMLRRVAERLRRELPGVPIMTSAFDREYGHTSGLDEVVDVWVSIIAHFNTPEGRARAERARQRGARVVWYTTIWPPRPYPNLFIEYDAIEARLLMGAMAQKYRPDGFGYWAINWWFSTSGQRPLTTGPYTEWNPFLRGSGNGEGSLIYAGADGPITSIRLENFRDGIEDYEYYQVLAAALERAAQRGVAPVELAAARALLEVPGEVVSGLTEFTRDPEVLARHRLAIAEAIEGLYARR